MPNFLVHNKKKKKNTEIVVKQTKFFQTVYGCYTDNNNRDDAHDMDDDYDDAVNLLKRKIFVSNFIPIIIA